MRTVNRQARFFTDASPLLQTTLNGVPDLVAVLNQERQIVYANKNWINFLLPEIKKVTGLRPGEAICCTHAHEMEAGCGTSEACARCGAAQAILASQQGRTSMQECRIARQNGDALDLRIWATPIVVNDEPFTIFAASDISHEKRRLALERIFYHDILNAATGLLGWADLLSRAQPDDLEEFQTMIHRLTQRMIDAIKNQKILTAAENNELTVQTTEIDVPGMLQELAQAYSLLDLCSKRQIAIDPTSQPAILVSDPTLLQRVLENMLKNALEASQPGETITMGCNNLEKNIEIWVHNPESMPREVQLQVFQRSFSTKGEDRGLGTYSMKLLGERYLKAKVTFESSAAKGTTFRIICPAKI